MMAHGRELTTHISYMDGVPVKIGEKYKPPRKVTLPVGFQHRISYETVSEEYEFRLERSVLEKIGEWRALRKAAADSRKDRIKAHEDAWQEKLSVDIQKLSIRSVGREYEKAPGSAGACTKNCPDSRVSSTISSNLTYPESVPSSVSYTNASLNPTPSESFSKLEVQVEPTSVKSGTTGAQQQRNAQYSHRTSILTPVPFSQNSSNINSTKSSSQFNFSDFEADTSSPFDNMELKTINEMEELAHVLQPISNSPDSKEGTGQPEIDITNNFASTTSSYSVNQTATHYNTIGSKPTKDNMILTHINGLTGYSSYSTTPRMKERESRNESYVNTGHNVYDPSSNVPIDMTNMFSYYPHQMWNMNVNINHHSAYHTVGSRETSGNPTSNISSTGDRLSGEGIAFTDPEASSGLNSAVSFPSTYNQRSSPEEQQEPGHSLSKSVPDIVQELEKELAAKRVVESCATATRMSHTPPPRPNSFGSTGLEDWKPWPDLDSPEQMQSKQKKSPGKQRETSNTNLHNPFHELSASNQKLAKHISEMGFALARVARGCTMFGEDDKKVVEFLLQVQALEEKEWPGDLAEKAIVANDHNIAEAEKYLEALIQLLDLGFSEDKVSDALVMFQNDRDKALDHLIS